MFEHIGFASRVLIGSLLVAGSLSKGLNFRWFVGVVTKYLLTPAGSARAIAFGVALVELVMGTMLLGGWLLPWSAFGAVGLLIVLSTAITVNLVRGRFDVECGCAGFWKKKRIGWDLLCRNAGLSGFAVLSSGAVGQSIPLYSTLFLLSICMVAFPFIPKKAC